MTYQSVWGHTGDLSQPSGDRPRSEGLLKSRERSLKKSPPLSVATVKAQRTQSLAFELQFPARKGDSKEAASDP